MRRNGFTLVELLAVIVILAIIALIATPIIMNVVNNARAEAAKRSVEGYAKALELTYYIELTTGTGTVNIKNLTAEYSGARVNNCLAEVEDGKLKLTKCTVEGYGETTYSYENGRASAE